MFPKYKKVFRSGWWPAWIRQRKYSREEIIQALDAVWSDQKIKGHGNKAMGDWSEYELAEPQEWEIQLIDRLRVTLIAETLSSIKHNLGIDRDHERRNSPID